MSDRFIPQAYQDYILDKIAECTEQAMCSQAPTTYFNVVRPPLWLSTTAYVLGAIVHSPTSNGKVYECTTGGTSGGTEPGWGITQDQTFTDGTVTWKTHDNYALVNRDVAPADFAISDNIDPLVGGRKLLLAEDVGILTHTTGEVSHCALICGTDKSLRYVTPANTTLGSNTIESGRLTIFYDLTILIPTPVAPV